MSADTKGQKRKSGDDAVPVAKKAKTAKSADQPAPLKSALKKAKVETVVAEKKDGKVKKAKASAKKSEDVPVVEERVETVETVVAPKVKKDGKAKKAKAVGKDVEETSAVVETIVVEKLKKTKGKKTEAVSNGVTAAEESAEAVAAPKPKKSKKAKATTKDAAETPAAEEVVETVVAPKPKKETKAKKTKAAPKDITESEEVVKTIVAKKPKKDAKAKTAKPATKQPEAADEDDSTLPDAPGLTPDQTAALMAGFSSSDEDEDDAPDAGNEGLDLASLPKPPTSAALKQQLTAAADADAERTPGVLYLSRIPHGFYEKQMRAYFSQFGAISNLRLARNRRTGASRHYAFIEFASGAVAAIVAKTMDKYLLFGHILQVRTVPREQVREGIWKGLKSGRARPRNRMEGRALSRGLAREGWEKRVAKEERRRSGMGEKLAEMGYEFEMPEVKSVGEVLVREKVLEAVPAGGAEGEAADVQLVEELKEQVVEVEESKVVEPVKEVEIVSTTTMTKVKGSKRKGVEGGAPVKKTKKVKVTSTV